MSSNEAKCTDCGSSEVKPYYQKDIVLKGLLVCADCGQFIRRNEANHTLHPFLENAYYTGPCAVEGCGKPEDDSVHLTGHTTDEAGNIHHACLDVGWILFDNKGEPMEWPKEWPDEVDSKFLKSRGIEVVPC